MNREPEEELRAVMKEAFPPAEPSSSLEHRLNAIEAEHVAQTRRLQRTPRFRRTVFVFAFGAFAVLGVAAFKFLLGRPGEAAIQLIPADATVIGTLDTNPSENQLIAFKHIQDAMDHARIPNEVDDLIGKQLDNKSPLVKQIRPYISKNLAFACWNQGRPMDYSNNDFAVLLALTNSSKVGGILQQSAEPNASTPGMYELKAAEVYGGVIGDYLVLTSKTERFREIQRVAQGNAPSAASLAQYQLARAALPADSNLMLFVTPAAYESMHQDRRYSSPPPMSWFSVGAAVRDQGLSVVYREPSDDQGTIWRSLAQVADLAPKILRELPEGAYGVLSWSQPAKLLDAAISEDKDAASTRDEFSKDMGLDLEHDVLPGLNGTFQVAVYPGVTGEAKDLDVLAVFDNANGADPIAVAGKVREAIETKSSKDKHPIHFTETVEGPAKVWRVDSDTKSQITKSIASDDKALTDKEPVVLLVNGEVIVGSSNAIANKALGVYMSNARTLADDISFINMSQMASGPAQVKLMVCLGRIFRPDAGSDWQKSMSGFFGGANSGLVGTFRSDGGVANGTLFIPLDWDKAMTTVSQYAKGMEPQLDPKAKEFGSDAPKG